MNAVKRKKFTLQDQLDFAELSYDFNPIHVDQIKARRLMYGQLVVHGINGMLWAISKWAEKKDCRILITKLDVVFLKPIILEEEVSLVIVSENENRVEIHLFQLGLVASRIKMAFTPRDEKDFPSYHFAEVPVMTEAVKEAKKVEVSEMSQLRGRIKLFLERNKAAAIYGETFVNIFGLLQIAELTAATRLVGMHVPGLNSLFSELYMESNSDSDFYDLEYTVEYFDSRFNLAVLSIQSPSFHGSLKTFLRPEPVSQERFVTLKTKVHEKEFAGQRALVIGGSRGLGEVTAKLLAGGGADVMITYNQGLNDARLVTEDIKSNGGRAECLFCNVLDLKQETLTGIKQYKPTHLYFFATPTISVSTKGTFSKAKFQKFIDFYVDSFFLIVKKTTAIGVLNFFYPSSIYVEEMPVALLEYTMAKQSGEMLCDFMKKIMPEINIYKPRLHRMTTDQTVGLIASSAEDALVLLIDLRKFHNLTAGALNGKRDL